MISKCLLLVMFFVATNSCGDFYWRDYYGKIPHDAIPAGNNSNGLSYIGQGYVHNYGLLLGTIIPGQMEISIPCYGVKKVDVIIKILCASDSSKYYWLPTTTDTYQKDTGGRCPVLGGYDQHISGRLGTLHVGRTRSQGDVIIGNVAAYDKDHTWFYYPLNDTEIRASEFQILCAKEPAKYYWLPTTTATYQRDTTGKCPVLGGYDQKVKDNTNLPLGILHVGRTRSQGDVIIGNVAAYDIHQTWFYYPLHDTENRLSEFEVLVYDDYDQSMSSYRDFNFIIEYWRIFANIPEHRELSANRSEHSQLPANISEHSQLPPNYLGNKSLPKAQ